MTRTLLIALSVTALAGIAGLGAAGAAPAGPRPARSCFFADQVTGWRQVNDQAVLVDAGGKQIYRLDLMGPCRDLDTELTIGLETRGGGNTVCDGLDVTVIARSPIGPMRCPVTKVTRLTPQEVAALPKKDIP